MDQIYGGAELTIIAASGINPSSGLPGIQGTSRQAQQTVKIGSTIFVVNDVRDQVKHSRWHKRGWTYQEALLSPRRLVFTSSNMYFQCGVMNCSEGLIQSSENRKNSSLVFPHRGVGDQPWDATDRIREYFPKQLSFGSDALNAYEGIMHALESICTSTLRVMHFYGIPIYYEKNTVGADIRSLAKNLVWTIDSSVTKVNSSLKENVDSPAFPSWTWAAFKARFPNAMNNTNFYAMFSGRLKYWNPTHLDFCITYRDGGKATLIEFTTRLRTEKSSSFFPWIDVTTWTIRGPMFSDTPKGTSRSARFLLSEGHEKVYLDDNRPWNGETAIALYMGTYEEVVGPRLPQAVFLLVRETAPRTFCRVGIWYVELKFTLDLSSDIAVLTKVSDLREGDHGDSFKLETLRLV